METELIFREYLRWRSRIASSGSDENGQDQVESEWPIFSKLRKVTGRSFPQEETGELKDVSVTVSRPKCSSDTPGGFPQVTASFQFEESAHKSTCIFREKGRKFLKETPISQIELACYKAAVKAQVHEDTIL